MGKLCDMKLHTTGVFRKTISPVCLWILSPSLHGWSLGLLEGVDFLEIASISQVTPRPHSESPLGAISLPCSPTLPIDSTNE